MIYHFSRGVNMDKKKKISKKTILLSLGFLVAFAALIIIIAMVPGGQNDSEQSDAASIPTSTASLPSLSPAVSLPDAPSLPESSALDNSDLPESSASEPDTPDASSQGSASHQAPISTPPVSQGSPSSAAPSSQAPPSSAVPSYSAAPPPVSSEPERIRVNINTATEAELTKIPNVLRTKARLIIMYREEHGPFASVDELLNVQGIGPETLESMRPYIYV